MTLGICFADPDVDFVSRRPVMNKHLRLSTTSLSVLAVALAAALATLVDAALRFDPEARARRNRAALAETLQLSDLSLFTEARYTRHPALADLHSAFQDHPAALDHFPSAAWMPPTRWHEKQP